MTVPNIELWLSLHAALGGTAQAAELLRTGLSAEQIFAVSPSAHVKAGVVTPGLGERLEAAERLLHASQDVAAVCRNFGWTVVTPESPGYPGSFRELKDPPLAVFCQGDVSLLRAQKACAVVGTRQADPAALIAAYRLGRTFSQNGIVTVSGGALGVDSASHEGALDGPGTTVCVLGNGFGHPYMPEKAFLRRRIAQRGLLVTEQKPFAAPVGNTFPRRNRLIIALGGAVCVVQSGVRGGSMHSANYAKSYHRPMFALPPEVCASPGCDKLLAEGAAPLTDAGQVTALFGVNVTCPLANDGAGVPHILDAKLCTAEEYAELNGVSPEEAMPLYRMLVSRPDRKAPKPKAAPPPRPKTTPLEEAALKRQIADAQGLTGDERAVFLALHTTPTGADELAEACNLDAARLMAAVTLLELSDLAETLPGDRVLLKL